MPMFNAWRDVECRALLDVTCGLASVLHAQPARLHVNHLTRLVAMPLGPRAWIEVIPVHTDVGGAVRRDRTGDVGGIEGRRWGCRSRLLSCVHQHTHHTESENPKEHERATHVSILPEFCSNRPRSALLSHDSLSKEGCTWRSTHLMALGTRIGPTTPSTATFAISSTRMTIR